MQFATCAFNLQTQCLLVSHVRQRDKKSLESRQMGEEAICDTWVCLPWSWKCAVGSTASKYTTHDVSNLNSVDWKLAQKAVATSFKSHFLSQLWLKKKPFMNIFLQLWFLLFCFGCTWKGKQYLLAWPFARNVMSDKQMVPNSKHS